MDVYMIWAHESGSAWLVDSWDDDSISGNGFGWEEAKDKASKLYKDTRVIKASVDFDRILAAFDVAETTLTIEDKDNN